MPERVSRTEPVVLGETTRTCPHCRYEYAAGEDQCTICGYPWPWLQDKQVRSAAKEK